MKSIFTEFILRTTITAIVYLALILVLRVFGTLVGDANYSQYQPNVPLFIGLSIGSFTMLLMRRRKCKKDNT